MSAHPTPAELRQQIRSGAHPGNTSGLCQGFVQCNVAILPADWAAEFLQFCQLNPKPCPLVAMSSQPGQTDMPGVIEDFDIRTDVPSYRIFKNGKFEQEVSDIRDHWRGDLVTFLLGCSFSFEEALIADGLEVRNIAENKNVPMYRSNIACKPAGRFSGDMVVSMRPFEAADAIRSVQICTRFPSVHGAPVHLGDPSLIGINDINITNYGDPVTINPNELPVFWACGVTPQVALEQAKPPFCITHSPGCMVVTDMPNSKLAIM